MLTLLLRGSPSLSGGSLPEGYDIPARSRPDLDFTFLRRPDGHEIGGIFGLAGTASASWATTFEVADTDAVVAQARQTGGTAGDPEDMVYGRIATITDPFGAELSVITRAPTSQV